MYHRGAPNQGVARAFLEAMDEYGPDFLLCWPDSRKLRQSVTGLALMAWPNSAAATFGKTL